MLVDCVFAPAAYRVWQRTPRKSIEPSFETADERGAAEMAGEADRNSSLF
jgi:hypothetical protein